MWDFFLGDIFASRGEIMSESAWFKRMRVPQGPYDCNLWCRILIVHLYGLFLFWKGSPVTTLPSALLSCFSPPPTYCAMCRPSLFLCLQKYNQCPEVACISTLWSEHWAGIRTVKMNGYVIHLVKAIWLLGRFLEAQICHFVSSKFESMAWK